MGKPKSPTLSELASTLKALEEAVLAELEALKAKLPADAQPALSDIEAIVREKVDALDPAVLVEEIKAELVALVTTGQGPAPHDATELA